MRSLEEYENTLAEAETSSQAMWWLLALFLSTKLLYTINMDAIWLCISFAQMIILFQNFTSTILPAPAQLVFEQLYMMVCFSPNQYP